MGGVTKHVLKVITENGQMGWLISKQNIWSWKWIPKEKWKPKANGDKDRFQMQDEWTDIWSKRQIGPKEKVVEPKAKWFQKQN